MSLLFLVLSLAHIAASLSLTASPSSVALGDAVTVSWAETADSDPDSFLITIVPVGTPLPDNVHAPFKILVKSDDSPISIPPNTFHSPGSFEVNAFNTIIFFRLDTTSVVVNSPSSQSPPPVSLPASQPAPNSSEASSTPLAVTNSPSGSVDTKVSQASSSLASDSRSSKTSPSPSVANQNSSSTSTVLSTPGSDRGPTTPMSTSSPTLLGSVMTRSRTPLVAVGIVFGILFFFALVILLFIFVRRYRRKRSIQRTFDVDRMVRRREPIPPSRLFAGVTGPYPGDIKNTEDVYTKTPDYDGKDLGYLDPDSEKLREFRDQAYSGITSPPPPEYDESDTSTLSSAPILGYQGPIIITTPATPPPAHSLPIPARQMRMSVGSSSAGGLWYGQE